MHYYAIVLVEPESPDVDRRVAEILAPYHCAGSGWGWDWFQIGGRWTGILTGYDPAADERNVEHGKCSGCGGTGREADAMCHYCSGRGRELKRATQFVRYPGDISRAGDVNWTIADRIPFVLIFEGGIQIKKTWRDKSYAEDLEHDVKCREILRERAHMLAVVVDCHG